MTRWAQRVRAAVSVGLFAPRPAHAVSAGSAPLSQGSLTRGHNASPGAAEPSPLVRPGPVWGPYPERSVQGEAWWQAVEPSWQAIATRWRVGREQAVFLQLLAAALGDSGIQAGDEVGVDVAPLAPQDSRSMPRASRLDLPRRHRPPQAPIAALRAQGFTPALCAQTLAHLSRVVERHKGFTPHISQHLAAWTMLQGCLVEMATGEGKTLATFLAAATAGLAGVPVHVLTANDYLAERDAAEMAPLYEDLGLRVDHVVEGRSPEARRHAYAADITYASAKELAFDHLRDRVAADRPEGALGWQAQAHGREPPLLRGLCLALLDEADSILCDEASVPLILAEAAPDSADVPAVSVLEALISMARQMKVPDHARLEPSTGQMRLRSAGRTWLDQQATLTINEALGHPFQHRLWREDWLLRALTVLHTLQRDRDYAVADGAIVFIDALTGRASPMRQWSRGLHQLLAVKEDLVPTAPQQTRAQMTFQRLFRRYHHLGGMSGTLKEVRLEMATTYGTPVVPVARHHPNRLQDLGTRVLPNAASKWACVVARVQAVHQTGRPVLVGTGSVAESMLLAGLLRAEGLKPLVLNAVQSSQENAVIGKAGQRGRITVSTQMAGRGTDIRLTQAVLDLGGLHVIACGQTHATRQWRQLIGRAARQGDAGSAETVLALDSGVLSDHLPAPLRRWLGPLDLPSRWSRVCVQAAMRRQEWQETRRRRVVSQQDRAWASRMAFSGPEE